MTKILLISELQKKIQENKKIGKKIVLCHGVFEVDGWVNPEGEPSLQKP